MNPVDFLVVLTFCLLVFRFHMPFAPAPRGEVILSSRVPIPARVRLQRSNVYAVGAVMLLGGLGGWLPLGGELLLAAGVMGALFLPLDYRFTEREIALGRARPRARGDFESTATLAGRIVLKANDGRDVAVWLPGGDDDRAVAGEIGRLMRANEPSVPVKEVAANPNPSRTPTRRRESNRAVL